jgi:high-affinity nickel permease
MDLPCQDLDMDPENLDSSFLGSRYDWRWVCSGRDVAYLLTRTSTSLCCSLFCIVHHLALLHEGFRAFLEVREDSLIEYEIAPIMTIFGFRSDTESHVQLLFMFRNTNASAYIR